ncbi:terminase TerL endonuclease subunit [Ruegeria arenilitoris]|uniref:terminase TerL endonuclease subunit n=1 Tax=Ruegeria arenilitoris TaxID=1173585 RepID=UPI00147A9257|nr:terminase TerL endonuclease subunit [Ruegeria arenilitoris]
MTACVDWAERLQRGEFPQDLDNLPINTLAADRISKALGMLRLTDKPGKPLLSDLPNIGWIDTGIRALFGGTTIREAFWLVPKKQGKSALLGLAFFAAFVICKQPKAAFTIVSPSIGISDLVFSLLVGAVEADEFLTDTMKVQEHLKTITNMRTGATMQVKSFSLDTVTGLRGYVLLDEVHLMGASKAGTKVRAQIKGALAVNPDVKVIYVTTQADAPPRGVFSDLLTHARGVRDGTVSDPTFLPILWEPWQDMPDPLDHPELWPKLLPSYPHIGDDTFYKSTADEAIRGGPSAAAIARSQFFNVEVGIDATTESWYLAQEFLSLAKPDLTIDEVIRRCDRVAVGVDLGGLADLTGVGVVGVTSDDQWLAAGRAYCTQKAIDENEEYQSKLMDCVDDGDLMIVKPGEDLPPIVKLCERIRDADKLHAIGIDPAAAIDLVEALEAAGFTLSETTDDERPVMGIGQSAFRLNPAVKSIERKAEERHITIQNSRLMAWTFGNTISIERNNCTEIGKSSENAKIDPVAGILDAVSTIIMRRPKVFDAGALIGALAGLLVTFGSGGGI